MKKTGRESTREAVDIPRMNEALETLLKLRDEGVLARFAIGGAIAAGYYIEAVATEHLFRRRPESSVRRAYCAKGGGIRPPAIFCARRRATSLRYLLRSCTDSKVRSNRIDALCRMRSTTLFSHSRSKLI